MSSNPTPRKIRTWQVIAVVVGLVGAYLTAVGVSAGSPTHAAMMAVATVMTIVLVRVMAAASDRGAAARRAQKEGSEG
jgi:small-conductance mechanosensitive channel